MTKKKKPQRTSNRKALWSAYKDLQAKADKALGKLKEDLRKSAKEETINKDNNHLLLLLGECDYMAKECMRIASKGKKKLDKKR